MQPPLEYWVAYGLLVLGVGWWAWAWGRHVVAWAIVAFVLTPLVAAVGLLIKGRVRT